METYNLPVKIGKMIILILGAVILGVGLYSHFQSSWIRKAGDLSDGEKSYYEICQLKNESSQATHKCPDIAMERYFISVIIICFVLSLVGFVAGYFVDLQSPPLKYVDTALHGLSALLLLIGSIMYLVSAAEIDNLHFENGDGKIIPFQEELQKELNFRKAEKIAAGTLSIIQAYIYGMVAVLILVSEGKEPGSGPAYQVF